jgi:outer membrane protein TolC
MKVNGSVKKRNNSLQGWAAILLGSAMAAVPALLPAQVSLPTVVDLAQRNSSAVKLADAERQKAQAALDQMHAALFPSLSFGSGLPAFPSVGFTGGVPSMLSGNAQYLVFSIPQKYYLDAARNGLKAASLNLKDAQEQVALDVSTTYIELDTINHEMEVTSQQEAFADRLVTIERERAEAGVDPLSDLLQAQLTSAELKLKRLHLETRAGVLSRQLANLTGLPVGSISPDHASIPEIPQVKAEGTRSTILGIQSAQMAARSKQQTAKGDAILWYMPQVVFGAQYSRSTTLLNHANDYYRNDIPANNFSSGFSIQLPLFDLGSRAKARQSAADALRATVEAEQAQRQNEMQISELTGSLRELDTLAEIASLKQQIASEQLHSVLAQLELGGGTASGPVAQPQISPKLEQLARINERQKFSDSLDAGLELSKARLGLLRALGHMQDWLNELHGK